MQSYKITFKNIFRSIKLAWNEKKLLVIVSYISMAIFPILSYFSLFLTKEAIHLLTEESNRSFMFVLIVFFSLIVETISYVYGTISAFISDIFSMTFLDVIKAAFLRSLSTISIKKLENPDFYNEINAINSNGIPAVYGCISIPAELFQYSISFVIATIVAIKYNFWPIFIYILLFPVILKMEQKAQKLSIYKFEKGHTLQRKSSVLQGMLTSKDYIYDIKSFQSQNKLMEIRNKREKESFVFENKIEIKYSFFLTIKDVLKYIYSYVIYVFLSILVFNGEIDISEFTLIAGVAQSFAGEFRNFFVTLGLLRESEFWHNKFYEYMDSCNEVKKDKIELPDMNKLIRAQNVYFKYPGQSDYQLKNINFHINKGEKIAIVGYNGAGKSTLVKLILGLYEPDAGEMFFKNQSYTDLDKHMIADEFSVALQNIVQYPTTFKKNITISDSLKNEDKKLYDDTLKVSGLCDVCDSLPNKSETYLAKEIYEKASGLSGGEWHKVVLARALFRKRDILIFDEPLASLDVDMETFFVSSLLKEFKNQTVIIITHQLSCIKYVDRIIVMENGEIVETGSHSDLMQKGEVYYTFFKAQSEKYDIKDDEIT